MRKFIIILFLAPFLSFSQPGNPADPDKSGYVLKDKIHQWYVPNAKGTIIFFHGLGEKGSDINRVLNAGLPKHLKNGLQIQYNVFAGQDYNGWWTFEESNAVIEYAKKATGDKMVIVTGLSAGANAVYRIIEYGRQDIICAIPISINSNGFDLTNSVGYPVWHFHGERDGVPNAIGSTEATTKLYEAKFPGQIKRTVFPGVGHNAWDIVYLSKTSQPAARGDNFMYAPFDQNIWDWISSVIDYTPEPEPKPIKIVIDSFQIFEGYMTFTDESGKEYRLRVE